MSRLLTGVTASAIAMAALAATASVTLATPVGRSALRSYDDDIGDVVTAPDISGSSVVTNDNFVLTIGVHVRGRSSFLEGDVYGIYFDTDSNVATGTDALSGAPPGAEYSIEIAHGKTWLLRWHASSFEPLTPRTPIATVWLAGLGPTVQVAGADLGDPETLRFVFVTARGDYDLAPNTGMWSYELSPFVLTAGQLSVAQARARKPVVASMSVERSDFQIPLSRGTIGCAARIGRSALHGRGAFLRERASCTWHLPTRSAGKRLAGSVHVTFQDVSAERAFNVRVR